MTTPPPTSRSVEQQLAATRALRRAIGRLRRLPTVDEVVDDAACALVASGCFARAALFLRDHDELTLRADSADPTTRGRRIAVDGGLPALDAMRRCHGVLVDGEPPGGLLPGPAYV